MTMFWGSQGSDAAVAVATGPVLGRRVRAEAEAVWRQRWPSAELCDAAESDASGSAGLSGAGACAAGGSGTHSEPAQRSRQERRK